ncbi:MAG: hypothetical protein NTX91_03955 [candidate division SR1 bacterium]|nr:hypothetical protein [candidate division SR1 bacterium]
MTTGSLLLPSSFASRSLQNKQQGLSSKQVQLSWRQKALLLALNSIIKRKNVSDGLNDVLYQLVVNIDGQVLRSQEVIDIFWHYDRINKNIPPSSESLQKYPSLQRFLSRRQVKIPHTDTIIQLDHFLVFLCAIRTSLASWRNENALLKLEADNTVDARFHDQEFYTAFDLSKMDDIKKSEFDSLYQTKYLHQTKDSPSVLSRKSKDIVAKLKLGEACEDQIIEYMAIISRLDHDQRSLWMEKIFSENISKEVSLMMGTNGSLAEISLEDLRNVLSALDLGDHRHTFPAPLLPKHTSKKSKKE